jgi:selenocysteine lyase/cysteine desulfurase
VYGPHTSVLYVRASVLKSSVASLAHHFLDVDTKSYKLQPGGPGYELVYGSTGVVDYLLSLTPANDLMKTFEAIAVHEQELLKPLLAYLTDPARRERGVRIVGDEKPGPTRVPTISFVVVGQNPLKSKDIVKVFDQKGGVSRYIIVSRYTNSPEFPQIGIRWGHFYAYTLVDELSPKVDVDDGVVRISLVHYNTVEEVHKIIEVLKTILG